MVRLLRRFKRKLYRELLRLLRLFLAIILLVSSFSFESKAEDTYDMSNIYTINMSRPDMGDNSGYIELLLEGQSSGQKLVQCIFWHMFEPDAESTLMNIELYQSSVVLSSGMQDTATVFAMSSDGRDNPAIISDNGQAYREHVISLSGYNLLGYKVYGNYGTVYVDFTLHGHATEWDVLYIEDSLQVDLLAKIYRCIDAIMAMDSDILSNLYDILSSCETMEDYLKSCVDYLNSIDSELKDIGISLDEINEKYDQLLQYEANKYTLLNAMYRNIQNMTNYLNSIMTSNSNILTQLKKLFKAENSTDLEEQEFKDDITAGSDKLHGLNEQNKVDKVDVNSASGDVDSNIDFDSMAEYGGVLASFTSNEYIIPFFLVVFAVALVSYVLFGKR